MIDRSKIDTEKLLSIILDDCCGNINKWWDAVEIIVDYMPSDTAANTRPTKCSLKCGGLFLRDLGWGRFIWDAHYGQESELHSPENAVLVLMQAPVPPFLLKPDIWQTKGTVKWPHTADNKIVIAEMKLWFAPFGHDPIAIKVSDDGSCRQGYVCAVWQNSTQWYELKHCYHTYVAALAAHEKGKA